MLYSVVVEEKKDRRKPAYKLHVSVAALVAKTSLIWAIVKGAVKLIRNFLPDIAAEEKRGKEDDKGNTATEKDSKSTSEEKKRAAQRERAKAQAK